MIENRLGGRTGVFGFALLAITLLAAAGCKKEVVAAPPPPPAVTVAKPIFREVIEWDEYTGRLDPVESVEVRARVSGYIERADFHEGGVVKAGDVLFVIDARPFEAQLAKAQADVQRAQAQQAYSENEFKRLEGIRSSGVASELELENARQRMKEGEAAVASAQADVREMQLNVDWCKVTAPISGRISRKNVTPGNLVNGGTGNTTLLTTITSTDPIYCYIEADERSVLKYQKLASEKKRVSARDSAIPCFLGLSNETGFPHQGMVDFVDNRIDPATGTLRARGVFDNSDNYLLAGMFARVRIPGSGRYKTLLVPDAAVGTDQNQKFLLVAGPDDIVQYRLVKLGALFDGARAIEEGVTENDRVIINGRQRARQGTKVTPTEVAFDANISLTAPGSPATQQLPPTTRPTNASTAAPTTAPN
ncbi:MAG: efflux RND transporter periplasmic adaptor subunit [Anaerolineae bacterium]|nr:efflux RND transporter periplasmic adaptor subunit [Phycisphaerae bacterium]